MEEGTPCAPPKAGREEYHYQVSFVVPRHTAHPAQQGEKAVHRKRDYGGNLPSQRNGVLPVGVVLQFILAPRERNANRSREESPYFLIGAVGRDCLVPARLGLGLKVRGTDPPSCCPGGYCHGALEEDAL
jgi:hypothetical protein